MTRLDQPFPLIADGEAVISSSRQMDLYETHELITNIRGPIAERPLVVPPVYPNQEPAGLTNQQQVAADEEADRLHAEQARQEARALLKKKRQSLVTAQKHVVTKPQVPKPKPVQESKQPKGLAHYAQKLRQTDYILAEVAPTYTEPKNPSTKGPKKNSYDFLKRSQIYNSQDKHIKKDRHQAQELSLTSFEDLDQRRKND